jgi:hypothetical protein
MSRPRRVRVPIIEREGVYGCGHCGTYHVMVPGRENYCTRCRCKAPLIATEAVGGQPTGDSTPRPRSSPRTDTETSGSG